MRQTEKFDSISPICPSKRSLNKESTAIIAVTDNTPKTSMESVRDFRVFVMLLMV